MNNRFAVVLVAIVAVFGGILFFTKHKADAPTSGTSGSAQVSNHVEGAGAKGVTLVEYGDYQCPACTAYYPIVKQVVEQYKADIKFQFVNFPLIQIHQNAMAAHRAAEAADKQGKYWEMHDVLYEQHDSWENSTNASSAFEAYAQQLGLDMTKFKQDVASTQVNDIIQADIKKGNALKVNSTPTFYIDGKKLDQNPQDVASFGKLIENAIANKK